MQAFNERKYERISYEDTKHTINDLINQLNKATSIEDYIEVSKKIISIQNHIEEMYDYADIRNMRDAVDQFFSDEMKYWNEYKPKFDVLFLPFYENVLTSDYKQELHNIMPDNFFNTIEYQLRLISDDIVDLQKEESELQAQYSKLNRTKIMYDGEEKTISYISGFFANSDRMIRKKAHDTVNDFYLSKQSEYDEILYNLVTTRNAIAKKLGFTNYKEYSLYKLRRFGYNYEDISKFRNNIVQYIVPLCKTLSKWQQEKLALETLEYYDTVFFTEMPQPLYSGEELLKQVGLSFEKIDDTLASLYKEMLEKQYIDLTERANKVNFAITNYLTEAGLPVITGNFKNNYRDIDTTTHEMGHAFQKYCASIKDKDYIVSSLLKYPTFDIAEMFSHAMQLIVTEYIDNLFNEEDYKKYNFMVIYNLVTMLPYICLVDEFQEKIYTQDTINKEDIRTIWLELVNKYHLQRSNSGNKLLESGGYFYRQTHIYSNPFYYIDYALSYFGALAIWNGCSTNLDLFKEIGAVASYYPLNTLSEKYHMPNPFEEQTVQNMASVIEKKLQDLFYK